jgi:hypothetical protein
MTGIPGQPLIVHEAAFNTRFGSGSQPFWTDLTNRVAGAYTCQRGQQYQRSQAQAGTLNVNYRNVDGYLDPSNASSPYSGIDLYRPIRIRAQYPQTQNLLTGDQATAGEATPVAPGAIPAAMNIGGALATPTIVASGTAYQGTQVYQVSMPANATAGFFAIDVQYVPVQTPSPAAPTPTYSWSIQIRSLTSGANPSMAAAVKWFNNTGGTVSTTTGSTSVLTGSGTAGWTEVSVSGQPPAGAVYGELAVAMAATGPSSAWTFQADGLQWEAAAAPTGWTQPGTWYGIWAGALNALPRAFSGAGVTLSGGNRGVVRVTATDVLGILAGGKLNDCFLNTLLGYQPDFLYPLNDPAYATGTQYWQDWTGQRGQVTWVQAGNKGNTTAGASFDGEFFGTNGPVTALTNALADFDSFGPNGLWWSSGVSLTSQAAQVGPPPLSAWTRVMAVQMEAVETTLDQPGAPYNGSPLLRCCAFALVGPAPNGYPQISLSAYQAITWSSGGATYAAPYVLFEAWSAAGTHITQQIWVNNTPARLDDGFWKLIALSLSANGQTFTLMIGDTNTDATYSFTISTGGVDFRAPSATSYQTDMLGCWWAPWAPLINTYPSGSGPVQWGMNGWLGPVTEYDFAISSAQFADMWASFQTAYSGDTTGARAARYLTWAGWAGATAIDTGLSTMGPAGGLGSSQGPWSGASPLAALQPVVLLEDGMMYAGTDAGTGTGAPFVFHGRTYRQTQAVPVAVFGEGAPVGAAGEVPYFDASPGYDTAELINIALFNCTNGTSGADSIPIGAINTGSVNSYYPESMQQTINPATNAQALSLAQWTVNCAGKPYDRIATLVVQPSHTAGIWAACLGLDLDELVTLNRRPLGSDVLSIEAFTENLSWRIDPTVPSAQLTIQASPAALDSPWLLAALHTTLNATANSGSNSVTINALPDAAVNKLNQSMLPNQQLTFEPGTPRAETVTVVPPLPATALGYTTATLTVTPALGFTHAANTIVCSPLPTGVTNPAAYDGRSVLGVSTRLGF